jgi:hypothetical protein
MVVICTHASKEASPGPSASCRTLTRMNYCRSSRINYHAFFADALGRLRSKRRYRVFADLERIVGRFPHAIWHGRTAPGRDLVLE